MDAPASPLGVQVAMRLSSIVINARSSEAVDKPGPGAWASSKHINLDQVKSYNSHSHSQSSHARRCSAQSFTSSHDRTWEPRGLTQANYTNSQVRLRIEMLAALQ
jgi:hypothetical protein